MEYWIKSCLNFGSSVANKSTVNRIVQAVKSTKFLVMYFPQQHNEIQILQLGLHDYTHAVHQNAKLNRLPRFFKQCISQNKCQRVF